MPDRKDPDPSTTTATRARRKKAGAPSSAELGRRVKAAREAAGLTQVQAAEALDIPQRTYSDRERGIGLALGLAIRLVNELGYDPSILCPELVSRTSPSGS